MEISGPMTALTLGEFLQLPQTEIEAAYAELAPREQTNLPLRAVADARSSPSLADLEVVSKALAARRWVAVNR